MTTKKIYAVVIPEQSPEGVCKRGAFGTDAVQCFMHFSEPFQTSETLRAAVHKALEPLIPNVGCINASSREMKYGCLAAVLSLEVSAEEFHNTGSFTMVNPAKNEETGEFEIDSFGNIKTDPAKAYTVTAKLERNSLLLTKRGEAFTNWLPLKEGEVDPEKTMPRKYNSNGYQAIKRQESGETSLGAAMNAAVANKAKKTKKSENRVEA